MKEAEREKEFARRERMRAKNLAAQQEAYQKKLEISMRRSMQAPKKRTGKPVMARSKPLFRRKKMEKEVVEDEHAADQQYFQ